VEDKYRKAHTQDELTEIFIGKGIDEIHYPGFFKYYNDSFNELAESYKDLTDEDFEEEGSVQDSALFVSNLYIDDYLSELAKGHGKDWAHLFGHSLEDGEKEYILFMRNYMFKIPS
jgi:hypothetical protein